jgi:SHS2 domain-containing protein
MAEQPASFKEIEHTADLGVEITALTLPALFAVAGQALFALMVEPQSIQPRDEIVVSASGEEPEELLHAWLCELLAQFNIAGFIARSCTVDRLSGDRVEGRILGEKLDLGRHGYRTEIKGVTYHDFKLWQEDGTWRARVIFDV